MTFPALVILLQFIFDALIPIIFEIVEFVTIIFPKVADIGIFRLLEFAFNVYKFDEYELEQLKTDVVSDVDIKLLDAILFVKILEIFEILLFNILILPNKLLPLEGDVIFITDMFDAKQLFIFDSDELLIIMFPIFAIGTVKLLEYILFTFNPSTFDNDAPIMFIFPIDTLPLLGIVMLLAVKLLVANPKTLEIEELLILIFPKNAFDDEILQALKLLMIPIENREVPTTSRRTAGVDVPIPTLLPIRDIAVLESTFFHCDVAPTKAAVFRFVNFDPSPLI